MFAPAITKQTNTNTMKAINKYLETMKQAERYQNRLYSQYDTVRLVDFPVLSENGVYKWQVSE
jgi:hypothetical protein